MEENTEQQIWDPYISLEEFTNQQNVARRRRKCSFPDADVVPASIMKLIRFRTKAVILYFSSLGLLFLTVLYFSRESEQPKNVVRMICQ